MYQASTTTRRRSSSPGSRIWNHNTGYTGTAGIHSEVSPAAHVRNSLTERRTSNVMIAEEEIMKKEMRKLQASRKHMEQSMLSYSQKMRDISQRKSNHFRKSPVPFHTKNQPTCNTKGNNTMHVKGDVIGPHTTLPSISSSTELKHIQRDDYSIKSDNSSHTTSRKPESRMSVDSGISSLDSHRDSSRSSHDACDITDTDDSISGQIKHFLDTHQINESNNDKEKTRQRGRAPHRKRFRDSKTFKLAPLVDTEIKENEEQINKIDESEEEFETPRIIPFPDELIHKDLDISPLVLASIMECDDDIGENKVGDNMFGRRHTKAGTRKAKTKTPYVLFRPKVTQSPSLAALRHRLFRRFGPKSIYFRYSEEVLEALRSLSNSPQREKSGKSFQSLSPDRSVSPSKKSPVSSPTLHGLDLEELLEAHSLRPGGLFRLFMEEEDADEFFVTKDVLKLPKLSRERSFSAPSSKASRHSFVSKLDQVEENDDTRLKSALKKDDAQYYNNPNEKKNVKFFLPDIFMQANVCTSQPTEF